MSDPPQQHPEGQLGPVLEGLQAVDAAARSLIDVATEVLEHLDDDSETTNVLMALCSRLLVVGDLIGLSQGEMVACQPGDQPDVG